MSYAIDFSYRGLAVSATIDSYDAGDRMQPPEGGTCEDLDWEVEDIDEVLLHVELSTEGLDQMIRGFYRIFGRLPATLVARIERDWNDDLYSEATDYFWNDVGGPGGYQDYCYDG